MTTGISSTTVERLQRGVIKERKCLENKGLSVAGGTQNDWPTAVADSCSN